MTVYRRSHRSNKFTCIYILLVLRLGPLLLKVDRFCLRVGYVTFSFFSKDLEPCTELVKIEFHKHKAWASSSFRFAMWHVGDNKIFEHRHPDSWRSS